MCDNTKILIVNSQSMNESNATGITLRSMFSAFDSDCLFEVYYSQVNQKPFTNSVIRSISLPISVVPLNAAIRGILGKDRIKKYNQSIDGIDLRSKEASHNIKATLKSFVLGLINCSPFFLRNSELLRSIDSFQPDIIYTLGADLIPLRLARYFSKRYGNIPILVHYMDNWPETKYANIPALCLFRLRLLRLLKYVQAKNRVALVISEKMAIEYNARFPEVEHFPLMNAIDVNEFKKSYESDSEQSVKTIAYLGGLHLGRDVQLVAVQNMIDSLNRSQSREIAKLVIYTNQDNRDRFEHKFTKNCVEFRDYVPHEQVFAEYSKADVLLHIESFDSTLVEFTKYSVSTKISEYMYSGRPILVYGPKDIAVYQYIDSCHSGLCACDSDGLRSAIVALVFDEELRNTLGRNGYNEAIRRHTKVAAYQTITRAIRALLNDRN